ncbi:MAG: hypothetical protein Q8K12_10275 [Thiobacillus sp.]|nr:hypothetical protein [Thiobacillus sp.]
MNHKPETLDALLKDCKTPADVGSLYSQLLQRMIIAVWMPKWVKGDVTFFAAKQIKDSVPRTRLLFISIHPG